MALRVVEEKMADVKEVRLVRIETFFFPVSGWSSHAVSCFLESWRTRTESENLSKRECADSVSDRPRLKCETRDVCGRWDENKNLSRQEIRRFVGMFEILKRPTPRADSPFYLTRSFVRKNRERDDL